MANLEIYVLNVGQADAAVIKTPKNKIIVIDAVGPRKMKNLLNTIVPDGCEIAHMIITHPHWDHYSAASGLLATYPVHKVTLSPFWFAPGTAAYHRMINRIQEDQIPMNFLSGYDRTYPDGGTYPDFENQLCLELLGPPNDILKDLLDSRTLTPNHLSIISRLTYGEFSMVFAADAQMENWAHYDREGMLDTRCDVLKAAHHGSKRGTQWERLERLSPSLVVVSSDPEKGHHLPDLIGSATFLTYDSRDGQKVALTKETGSVKIVVDNPKTGRYKSFGYREPSSDDLFPHQTAADLKATDWVTIVVQQAQD